MIDFEALGRDFVDLEEEVEVRRIIEIPHQFERFYKEDALNSFMNQSDRSAARREITITMREKPNLMIFPKTTTIRERSQIPLRLSSDFQFMSFPKLSLSYLVLLEPDENGNPNPDSQGIPIPIPDKPHEHIKQNSITMSQYDDEWFAVRPTNESERILQYTDLVVRTRLTTDNQLYVEDMDLVGDVQQVLLRDINSMLK